MMYFIISIVFLSLLSVILLYNVLLGIFKKIFLLELLNKVSFAALITVLISSGLGLAYNKKILSIGLNFSYPPRFESLHVFLVENYIYPLLLAPIFTVAILYFLKRNRRATIWSISLALVSELLVLISTVLI